MNIDQLQVPATEIEIAKIMNGGRNQAEKDVIRRMVFELVHLRSICATELIDGPPDQPGQYWWWDGDADAELVYIKSIYKMGDHKKYYSAPGQYRWADYKLLNEMGGKWMKAVVPEHPEL